MPTTVSSYGNWGEMLFLPVKSGACTLNLEVAVKIFFIFAFLMEITWL